MGRKPRVVVVTDGDEVARKTLEEVARRVGGRCISLSAGNPTAITGVKLIELILQAPREPVLVMVDDRGNSHKGQGEKVVEYISQSDSIELIGVVAVASNTPGEGTDVDFSITREGDIYRGAVDKNGNPLRQKQIHGDTVGILGKIHAPLVVGTGDTGKMEGADSKGRGAPITTKAVIRILKESGVNLGGK